MDSTNRTVWIVIAVIVVMVLLCCCIIVVGAAVAGVLYAAPAGPEIGLGQVEETTEQVLVVGDEPLLETHNFAGDITVRSGESGEIRLIVTKRATSRNGLDRIDVDASERDGGVRVETSHPGMQTGSVSAKIEAFVPADTELDLHTGAGNVHITGVQGPISARAGAGNVRVQGAAAPVTLETGAGDIDYEGEPQSECSFDNGAGNIRLALPADANVEIELTTGIGSVDVEGFDVAGEIDSREAVGVIGTGEEATLKAHTGAGNVNLSPR